MKFECPISGSEIEPINVMFNDIVIVPNCERLDELAARIGTDWFRAPSERDEDVTPSASIEVFEQYLEEQTDLLTEHDNAHWNSVGRWSWSNHCRP